MSTIDQQINKHTELLDWLQKAREKFPDLGISQTKQEYYIADISQQDGINLAYRHSCGCCSDAVLYIDPYIEFMGRRIYHKSMPNCLGEKREYYDVEISGWEGKIKKLNLKNSDDLVLRIKKYFLEEQKKIDDDDE